MDVKGPERWVQRKSGPVQISNTAKKRKKIYVGGERKGGQLSRAGKCGRCRVL